MGKIYFTSDLHFNHNREFIYKPRGFDNVEDMNKTIVRNWNKRVTDEDDVYVLGDIMLNDNERGMELLNRLNGKIHIILGNHDTNTRIKLYEDCEKVVEVKSALHLRYKKANFFLSHYPTISSPIDEVPLMWHVFCLYGHTHQKTSFYQEIPWIYHVGVDSHNCTPITIDEILEDCKRKYDECAAQL